MANQIAMGSGISVASEDHFSYRGWILANAVGLGAGYALFALFGESAEVFGAEHDSVIQGTSAMAGLFTGGVLFVTLRYLILSNYIKGAAWIAITAGVGFTIGFVVGFMIGGPPIDFLLGIIALGTIGGSLQWRTLRTQLQRPGSLLLVTIGGWLLAAIAAVAVAILVGDPTAGVLGEGMAHFVMITGLIGLTAGAVGGAIEGYGLQRRLTQD